MADGLSSDLGARCGAPHDPSSTYFLKALMRSSQSPLPHPKIYLNSSCCLIWKSTRVIHMGPEAGRQKPAVRPPVGNSVDIRGLAHVPAFPNSCSDSRRAAWGSGVRGGGP